MPLPNGPGQVVPFDFLGPLPETTRASSYILLFTDRFGRHASMPEVTATNFIAVGTANVSVNQCVTK